MNKKYLIKSRRWLLLLVAIANIHLNPNLLARENASLKPFYHGVASGDPLMNAVVIWTRVTPDEGGLVEVVWRVATDPMMQIIVKSGVYQTEASRDYTVKVDVTGLMPGTTYYYSFSALGKNSLVGKTKTTPSGMVDQLRFAVVSCSNYQAGFFNAYGRIADRTDLDAVVHLGDYIYEYSATGADFYGNEVIRDVAGRAHVPDKELIMLDDYRQRYAQYRMDPDLRRAHQQHPFIMVWDDHESANDAYEEGAQNHNPGEGEWEDRKAMAKQAYLEWMPVRSVEPLYRTFKYGELAELIMIDTRLEAREKQLTSVADPALYSPDRTLLGEEQLMWLKNKLTNSTAHWKLIGNQVIFSEFNVGWAAAADPSLGTPEQVESIFLDIWDGYPVERDNIIDFIADKENGGANPIDNVVILTGDFHSAFAYDVAKRPSVFSPGGVPDYDPATGTGSVAVEFASQSVTSANFDENLDPALAAGLEFQINKPLPGVGVSPNPHMKYVDLDRHGYFLLDLTPEKAQADFYYVDILNQSPDEVFDAGFYTMAGENHLNTAIVPSAEKSMQESPAPDTPLPTIEMNLIGRFDSGLGEGAAEITAFDPISKRLFVVNNAATSTLQVLSIADPGNPVAINSIDITSYGGAANHVDVQNGLVAVAVEAYPATDPGKVIFFDTNGNYLAQVGVGALPDMLVFNPDGTQIVVANEGEPSSDYSIDPEGSISIITLPADITTISDANVQTADFQSFNADDLRAAGVRIFGPGATAAQDLEPEFVTITPDGMKAYVTLQENNAVAVVDLNTSVVDAVLSLGFKNHSLSENSIDASNRDGGINIMTWPVLGMYQPDAIASYEAGGNYYLVTANEGDARDYDTFSEEFRVKDFTLDPTAYPDAADLQLDENLGRLRVTDQLGFYLDGSNKVFEQLYSYGARSFSIWNAATGELVYDSGNDLEMITAALVPEIFNNDEGEADERSDDKGPEPEGVTIGIVNGKVLAFIGLERTGGVMIYDITDPMAPEYAVYKPSETGDVSPEGLIFISADESPSGNALVVVSNEVSGTVAIYEVEPTTDLPDSEFTLQLLHASDLEGGVEAIQSAPNFAAIIDKLEDEFTNTIILSSGDNYIPGPFFNAAGDGSLRPVLREVLENPSAREGVGRVDAAIMNIIGFDASAVGNHEFDAGTNTIQDIIGTDIRSGGDARWLGTQFPYLSANLDYSESNLADLFTDQILPSTAFQSTLSDLIAAANAPKLAPATIIEVNGEQIGVVGATTQVVESISSTGDVRVIGPKLNDMPALAAVLQPVIDQLTGMSINKIILVSHLQQFALEQELIGLLEDVDIVAAGGSDVIMINDNPLNPGDEKELSYPFVTTNKSGDPAVIVSTDGQYAYVGRLIITFDDQGVIMPESIDPLSDAYNTTDEFLATVYDGSGKDPFTAGSKGAKVQTLVNAVAAVVNAQDGNTFGSTAVYLDGRRSQVRTEETNLGNLTADANLAYARMIDPTTVISIKNGGGIRAAIGEVIETAPGEYIFAPPQANLLAGKEEGEISQLDIANSLRFNNALTLLTITARQLKEIVEHGVAATSPGATPGQFPQVGGMQFGFNPEMPAGNRVIFLNLIDEEGSVTEEIVKNGKVMGDQNRTFRIVTLNFLAGGGDGYPFPTENANRLDLNTNQTFSGAADFAPDGTEQDALAEYLAEKYAQEPYTMEETPVEEDDRIQYVDDIVPFVKRLILVNAETNQDIRELMDGDVIDFLEIGTDKLSIRAETMPEQVGSVAFFLNGNRIQLENIVPYAIAGDNAGGTRYNPWTPPVGKHIIEVIPYERRGAQGQEWIGKTINIEVIDGTAACFASSVLSYLPGMRKNGSRIPTSRTNVHNALGAPQESDRLNFVSLGFGGEIVLELGGKLTDDGTSDPDLIIVETSFGRADQKCFDNEETMSGANYPEKAILKVSQNGTDWYDVGSEFCRTSFIDLSAVMNQVDYVKYLKIIDVSDPERFEGGADGFDVDGVIACPALVQAATERLLDARLRNVVASVYEPNFINQAPDELPVYNLEVYPNPVSDQVEVLFSMEQPGNAKIQIVNALGAIILKQSVKAAIGNNTFSYSAANLEKGIYLLQLESGSVTETVKFVKQ